MKESDMNKELEKGPVGKEVYVGWLDCLEQTFRVLGERFM